MFPTTATSPDLAASTRAVHAADELLSNTTDVAPPINVSTTFRYENPLISLNELTTPMFSSPTEPHIYSRLSQPTNTALEATLSSLLHGHATTFGSGLAAFTALLIRVNPKTLHLGGGYHGCHGAARVLSRVMGMKIVDLTLENKPEKGDLVHLETPENPYGTAHSIAAYAKLAHDGGALLSVDSTFAPPPLQDPFVHGADWVLHSATKYFGGHSDMLGGVLVTQVAEQARELKEERMLTGGVMGGLEAWLELRSLKTLELRVGRQSETARKLVRWLKDDLVGKGVVKKVYHVDVQSEEEGVGAWMKEQMPLGGGPVFCLLLESESMAKTLPENLGLWIHATSLGGVESLVEWRPMSDRKSDRQLLRFSTGVEDEGDLRRDLENAFKAVEGV